MGSFTIAAVSGAKCAAVFFYRILTLRETIRRPSSALIMQQMGELPALTASSDLDQLMVNLNVRSRRAFTL